MSATTGLLHGLVVPILAGFTITVAVVLVGIFLCTRVVGMKRSLILIGAGLFCIGCIVYMIPAVNGDGGNIVAMGLAAANKTASAFFPSRGGFDGEFTRQACTTPEFWLNAIYWLFHLSVILYVSTIVVSVFGTNFCNKLWLARKLKKHRRGSFNVFWDFGAEAEATAKGLAKDSGNTIQTANDMVFAVPDGKKSWLGLRDDESVHALARKKVRWIFGDPGNPGLLAKADRHFFLSPNGHDNVASAARLIDNLPVAREPRRAISIYVRISADATDDILYRWADGWNRKNDAVEVVVVREESLVSKRFIACNPMLAIPGIKFDAGASLRRVATVDRDFKFSVLLVGFGAQGRALMNDMICNAQCLTENGTEVPVSIDVFDKSATSFGWFKGNCKDACERYNIQFHRVNAKCAVFWETLKRKITRESHYNRVVVCTRDDRTNIGLANDIARIYREAGIDCKGIVFARVRNESVNDYVENVLEEAGENASFSVFGRMSDTYSSDILVMDRWDKGAMWLNWTWSPRKDKSREELWREASFFAKESSRASFMGQRNLLLLQGYDVDAASNAIQDFRAEMTDEMMERLAETEHLRWMAFHFTRGIKKWVVPGSQADSDAIVKANRVADKNAHAALMPFKCLPCVDAALWNHNGKRGRRGNLQQIDRDFVDKIIPAMKEAGFGIRRLEANTEAKRSNG